MSLGRRLFLRMAAGALAAGMLRADLVGRGPALEAAVKEEVTHNIRIHVTGGGGGGIVGNGGGGGWWVPVQPEDGGLDILSQVKLEGGGGAGGALGEFTLLDMGGGGGGQVHVKQWHSDEPEPPEWTQVQ